MRVRAKLLSSPFDRVEIRACNLGADAKEHDGLRNFLGCKKIVAPNQDTFFETTKPEFLKPTTTLLEFCKKNGGADAFMIDGGFAFKVRQFRLVELQG